MGQASWFLPLCWFPGVSRVQRRGRSERLDHRLGRLSRDQLVGCFKGGGGGGGGPVGGGRRGFGFACWLLRFGSTWKLWFVSRKASGLWAGPGLRFRGNYGFNGGVSLHSKRFGREPGFGARDRFAGLRTDDGRDLHQAVAGVGQGTQVESPSHRRPPHLPGLDLHLSSHRLQQHLQSKTNKQKGSTIRFYEVVTEP